MQKYKNLFQSLTIKGMELKNRIAMMPMATNMSDAFGGLPDAHIRYYEQRAMGGTGLIIVENVNVDFPVGANGPSQLRFDHDYFVPRMTALVERVHRYDAKIAIQINHAGSAAQQARIGTSSVSSSAYSTMSGAPKPRALEKEELPAIAQKYADAARRAVVAGFDAVNVHCAHTYLLNQFLSPVYNKRTDEYGGSIENRVRFPRMVMEKVRETVGPNYPIIMRLTADDLVEGGNRLDDALIILEHFDDLADIYDVSLCVGPTVHYMNSGMHFEDGWRKNMSIAVREKFHKPVILQGNIENPSVAERLIAEGYTDIIGMGRAQIAEPQWVNKVQSGREDELRHCIYCNIGCCSSRMREMRPIHCTVNPDLINNDEYKNDKINKTVNVVVVGGGTAGMEAACTAAEVGCRAFVLEQSDRIGGLTRHIARLPQKKRIGDFADWLEGRASRLDNIHIFTNKKADLDTIKALKPHILINATGARPLIPNIPGVKERIDKKDSHIRSIMGIMDNVSDYNNCEGKSVTVIGGGAVGLDVMEFFAEKGAKVTVVEMLKDISGDLDIVTKNWMNDRINKYHVAVLTQTKLIEVRDSEFVVESERGRNTLTFDIGVVCIGMQAVNEGVEDLREFCVEHGVTFVNIGDSKKPRKLIQGSVEGRNVLTILRQMRCFTE
jgi:2,4-dienoyl-CoA reductase-like NADH-dependent reductase (Old Yellow Enzyme family)/thioredoxin reductase